MSTRPPTPKQLLAEHIAKHHQLPAGAGRWTLDRLAHWHHGQHHADTRQAALDHAHGGALVGATNYPEGWDTGAAAVPRKDHP